MFLLNNCVCLTTSEAVAVSCLLDTFAFIREQQLRDVDGPQNDRLESEQIRAKNFANEIYKLVSKE